MNSRLKRSDRPYVFLNMAMTADGKIATANRHISSFGSARDLAHLYALRATADAILCGARTVDLNDVTLGNGGDRYGRLRLRTGLSEFPIRIVVTGNGSLDPEAGVFRRRFSAILVLTTQRASRHRLARLRGLADDVHICGEHKVDLPVAMRWLMTNWGVRRLLCEGGGTLNDGLFRAGVVDEVNLTLCPFVFGGRGAPTVADGLGFRRVDDSYPLQLHSKRRQGDELFLVYRRIGAASDRT